MWVCPCSEGGTGLGWKKTRSSRSGSWRFSFNGPQEFFGAVDPVALPPCDLAKESIIRQDLIKEIAEIL